MNIRMQLIGAGLGLALLNNLSAEAAEAGPLGQAEKPNAQGPWADAIAAWHFGDPQDAAGSRHLLVRGSVRLGVPLEGRERAESLARGGDGRAAAFAGGYLALASGDGVLNLPGPTFTLALRLRDPDGKWDSPLFGSFGDKRRASFYLRAVDGRTLPRTDRNYVGHELSTIYAWMFGNENGPRAIRGNPGLLEFIWGAAQPDDVRLQTMQNAAKAAGTDQFSLYDDTQHALLRTCFPVETIGPTAWHDIIVRLSGPKVQLFIDGVLVDEEYPLGQTRQNSVPCLIGAGVEEGQIKGGFRGLMDHVGVWSRALSDAEIVALSGGAEQASRRDRELLGPPPTNMQYFRGRGHNSKPGDCIPFFHDGTYHLFYLILRRNMHSKWDGGHGGLEIHHASTRDLIHWTQHPVTAPISEQWEAWNGTGGVVWHEGQFHWFYPTPSYSPQQPFGGIQLATSRDGEQFVKQTPHPFLVGGDCEVFPDPDPNRKLFHLLKAGPTFGSGLPAVQDKTLVSWVAPADLEQRSGSILTVEGEGGQFDGLVFGEHTARRWMAGSDNFRRTQRDQHANADETAGPRDLIQIAAVYSGREITLYRNGTRYAQYTVEQPLHFAPGGRVLIGLRHLARRGDPGSYFRGQIADARVYAQALTAAQIEALRPHQSAEPKPLVWFDFQSGGTADRAGTLAPAELEGDATIRDGRLVLGDRSGGLVAGGRKTSLAHLVSEDLRNWRELPEPFITTDADLVPQMCPHWFAWNAWYYFIGGGGGIWKSRQPFGPWTLQSPRRLDELAVPKTAAFVGNRRIYAGFKSDGGWGGNLVLRELVQLPDGDLTTRFVNELIPRSGAPLTWACEPLPGGAVQLDGRGLTLSATDKPARACIPHVPHNVRITMRVEPQAGVGDFHLGLRGRETAEQSCRLLFAPKTKAAGYSQTVDSGGRRFGMWMLDGALPLDQAFTLDIVCRDDLIDAELGGRRTLVNRYWDPQGDRLYLGVDQGRVTFTNIVIRPLDSEGAK